MIPASFTWQGKHHQEPQDTGTKDHREYRRLPTSTERRVSGAGRAGGGLAKEGEGACLSLVEAKVLGTCYGSLWWRRQVLTRLPLCFNHPIYTFQNLQTKLIEITCAQASLSTPTVFTMTDPVFRQRQLCIGAAHVQSSLEFCQMDLQLGAEVVPLSSSLCKT